MNSLNFLVLTKDTNGDYFIADNNYEKLEVLGELYLDKEAKADLLKNFDSFNEITIGNFNLLRDKDNIIILLYKNNESLLNEANPREVVIKADTLKKLFEDLEELEKTDVKKIIIAKEQDNYVLDAQY